jgi:hypothetical protein
MLACIAAAANTAAWNDHIVTACSDTAQATTPSEACSAYIEGFLDGALVTDTAIVESVTAQDSVTSDYFKRAYMTRVSQQRMPLPATALAHFCLPESTSRAEVVKTLASELNVRAAEGSELSLSLYDIIKDRYPCDE